MKMKKMRLAAALTALALALLGGCVAQATGQAAKHIMYRNETYGFSIRLPESWAGYRIVKEHWTGHSLVDEDAPPVSGTEILVRNPRWTKAKPWQDIPVMVFTHAQWKQVQAETLSVGAAPLPPSELGHNAHFVFALPARYNYAFLTGFEEVEKILAGGAFQAA